MNKIRSLQPILAIIAVLLSACQTPAAPTSTGLPTATLPTRTASLSEIVNLVDKRLPAADLFSPVAEGDTLGIGGQVKTGEASRVRLQFGEGSIVRMAENTSFTITEVGDQAGSPLTRINLAFGKLWISLAGGTVEIETPVGAASVRGSYAIVSYDPGDPADPFDDVLIVVSLECDCNFNNDALDQDVGNLRRFIYTPGQPPQLEIIGQDAIDEFLANNPDVAAALQATLTALPSPTDTLAPTSTDTPIPTDTTEPTSTTPPTATRRPPTLIPTITDTPLPTDTPAPTQPSCTPPEFYDPFMDRCRLPDPVNTAPPPTSAPEPYGGGFTFPSDGTLALGRSPLYQALVTAQPTMPVGALSGMLTLVGVVIVGWVYRRRGGS